MNPPLPEPPADLLAAAIAARSRAYAPYSGFSVGAALRGVAGGLHAGCNVENAAYPQGQCAEAAAIGAMVAAGERRIAEILVLGSAAEPCAPCGGCRQRLAEFATPDVMVHMVGQGGAQRSMSLGALLPEAFALRPPDGGAAAELALGRAPGFAPVLGLILGSGLDLVADAIEPVASIAYAELPGLPVSSVPGHAGRLVLGRLAGVPVACLRGRVHLYEGGAAAGVATLVELLAGLGCRGLVVTNASGALRADLVPGTVVRIADHLNLTGANPLVGRKGDVRSPFVDLATAYDAQFATLLDAAARTEGLELPAAVYLAVLGPSFETPAEIRAFRTLGADLVGMSTVPEVIAARYLGLRVAALSIVTNLASGLAPEPLAHDQTLAVARTAAEGVRRLLSRALPEFARALT